MQTTGQPGYGTHPIPTTTTSAEIDAKLDELRNHRADGVATTTDVIRVLEILKAVVEKGD
jgi:hypothetical protein